MHQVVESRSEKLAILSDMVRLENQLGVSALGWAEHFIRMLVDMPTSWVIVEPERLVKEVFADAWIRQYGSWNHAGGHTKRHNTLGMAYAWWALHENQSLDSLHLSDSPDFQGSMTCPVGKKGPTKTVRVVGDIGKCSPVALFEGLKGLLEIHDVWISVLDWQRHILIEFGYSPAQWYAYSVGPTSRTDAPGYFSEEELRNIFFCDCCSEWTITKTSRRKLLTTRS